MEGRKSSDKNDIFGFPKKLSENVFPVDIDLVNHSSFLKKEKQNSGEWKQNTPISDVARAIANDICEVWDKTDILHHGIKNPKWVKEKVEKVLVKAREVIKLLSSRKKEYKLPHTWGQLFDISLCIHRSLKVCDCPTCTTPHPEHCDCSEDSRVPDCWHSFLWDQRGARQQCLAGIDWGRVRDDKDKSEKERHDKKMQEEKRRKIEKSKEKSESDEKLLFATADDSELVDSQGDRLSQPQDEVDESDIDDDEWEGGVECGGGDVAEYNTICLPRFSRECDRYKQSNRGGAKLANALLKDLGFITKANLKFLVCPNKLRRERLKWGQQAVEAHSSRVAPGTAL